MQDISHRHMRSLIKTVPDGSYEGTAILEDAGHGFGDIPITATVTIKDDTCHIAIKSPPQVPYFINSYEGNSHSGVYLGLMMFAQLPPPYNEGPYRCVSVDFGRAGEFRGGSGTAWEVEPLDRDMSFITFGEGRRIPAMGAAGATSRMLDSKVGRIEVRRGGKVETIRKNVIETLKPGETVTNLNPGGGGYGNPYERPIEKVLLDVQNGLVSVAGAREDYGVVITDGPSHSVGGAATRELRQGSTAPAG